MCMLLREEVSIVGAAHAGLCSVPPFFFMLLSSMHRDRFSCMFFMPHGCGVWPAGLFCTPIIGKGYLFVFAVWNFLLVVLSGHAWFCWFFEFSSSAECPPYVVCTYGSGNLFLLIVALTRIYSALSDSIQFSLWLTFWHFWRVCLLCVTWLHAAFTRFHLWSETPPLFQHLSQWSFLSLLPLPVHSAISVCVESENLMRGNVTSPLGDWHLTVSSSSLLMDTYVDSMTWLLESILFNLTSLWPLVASYLVCWVVFFYWNKMSFETKLTTVNSWDSGDKKLHSPRASEL